MFMMMMMTGWRGRHHRRRGRLHCRLRLQGALITGRLEEVQPLLWGVGYAGRSAVGRGVVVCAWMAAGASEWGQIM